MNAVASNGFAVVGSEGTGLVADDPCECCDGQVWLRADLCNDGDAPPDVPRRITFRKGFICLDGCPVTGGRIILYRGYCYFVVSGTSQVECDGLRIGPLEYPSPYPGAAIAAWAELLCKPLTANCLNEVCVPVEPGCCTTPYTKTFCNNPPTTCPLPKRFRVREVSRYRYLSTAYNDPGTCSGLNVCEELIVDIDVYADYECDEENVGPDGLSAPVCFNVGGVAVVSGLNRQSSQFPPVNLNGTYPVRPVAEQEFRGLRGGWFGHPFGGGPVKWVPDELQGEFNYQFSQGFCGGAHSFGQDDPPGCSSVTETCPDGNRVIRQRTVNCNFWEANEIEYEDCRLYDRVMQDRGYSAPPCPRDLRWDDSVTSRITIINLANCQKNVVIGDGGEPVGAGRPSPAIVPPENEPVQLASWLGMNWRGTPYPKRLMDFVLKGTPIGTDPGCGCIDRLKSLVEKPKS